MNQIFNNGFRLRLVFVVHFLALLSMLGLTACSTVHAPPSHVLLVDHKGKPLYVNGPDGFFGRMEQTNNDFMDQLAAITNGIATNTACRTANGTRRILIYVHGGLNDYNTSLGRADEIIPLMLATNYYPVLISWDSGFKSSYLEALLYIRQGEVQRVWGPITSPLYLLADLGRAVTRAPYVWCYQMANDLSTLGKYETPNWTHKAKDKAMRRVYTNSPSLKMSIGGDTRTTASRLGYFGAYILTTPFKLVTGPLIDALGKDAWDNMERRTQTMFYSPNQFYEPDGTNEISPARKRTGDPGQGAVAMLMQAIDNLITNDPSTHYSITLIGHSMGTIVANEIIKSHPQLPYTNIVYMAAACSVAEFSSAVIPYLKHATNAHFYNLTLQPVADAREAQWSYLDITPRGSLLVWIDNFLSSPRTVPERTMGRWKNDIATTALIPLDVAGRIRIKAFAVGPAADLPDNPLVHGQFSEEEFWNEDFWRTPAP